jgi:hypothetical protein
MFAVGLLLLLLGLVGAVFAVAPPVEAARVGAIGVALGCGLSGALLAYLDAPRRRRRLPPGRERGEATVLEVSATTGSVAGYQLVELTLEVRPRSGAPYQVRRKFSAGRLGSVEPGRRLDVVYDPAAPDRIELA